MAHAIVVINLSGDQDYVPACPNGQGFRQKGSEYRLPNLPEVADSYPEDPKRLEPSD